MKHYVLAMLTMLSLLVGGCAPGTPATLATQPTILPATEPAAAEIAIKGFAFDQPNLTVKAGTTVTWTNQDSATHTVTSDAGDWDSGRLGEGKTFSHTFDQAGTFTYHCGIHSSMKGAVVVTP